MSSFFHSNPINLSDLASGIGADLKCDENDKTIQIDKAGPIEDAPDGCVSFLDNPKYIKYLVETKAKAVICSPKLAEKVPSHILTLVHAEPYKAYAKALCLLYPTAMRPNPITGETGISTHAFLGKDVSLEEGVIIEAGAVIGDGVAIGQGSHILANAVVGQNTQIGRNSTIGPNASVSCTFIGDNVIIHAGVRIGQDGFGFAMGPGGHDKVPQIGRVIIQDNVEIGANATIDRGSNRDTVIGEGTKIDNLVQIGHNVVIGRHCVIVGLAGIAGSATLGDYVVVAGQAGIVGHIKIGDGAQIGGGSGVNFDVAPGDKLIGYPALPFKDWVKMNMKLKSLIYDKKSKK